MEESKGEEGGEQKEERGQVRVRGGVGGGGRGDVRENFANERVSFAASNFGAATSIVLEPRWSLSSVLSRSRSTW